MRGWLRVLGGIAIVAAIFLVVGLILHYTAGPGQGATELVQQAAAAMDQVAVEGTVKTIVRTAEGEVQSRAEMHRGDGRFRMLLLSGPGEGTEVFRQGDDVWVERKGAERIRRASVGEHALRRELLERNWDFRTAGTRLVAGRRTTLVRGEGPGGSISLAVDQQTGFPLHISRRDRQGHVISETTWQDADFSVQPPPRAEPPEPRDGRHRRAVTLEEARAAVDFTVFEPGWLPDGWELQGWYVNERRIGSMVQARFSDGLRAMMVMQIGAADVRDRMEQRREQMGQSPHPRDGMRGGPRPERQPPSPGGQQPPRQQEGMRGEGMREHMERRGPMHMRGAGADASRRTIDGTLVIVVGPISEETRERVLESMTDQK